MSKRKIERLLKAKGIKADRIEYMRGEPTPSGYANGWDIDFSEETEEEVYVAGNSELECYMQFDTANDVYEFIEQLPNLVNRKLNPLKESEHV